VSRAADVRVVAATHRDLQARVAARLFREDLYFRLAVVVAEVPPLRERREDLPLLVEHFLSLQSPKRTLDQLPDGTLDLLAAHPWPGNVRELWNTLTRLLVFPALGPAVLSPDVGRAARLRSALDRVAHLPLKEAREAMVEEFELAYLEQKLSEHQGKVAAAADAMGVSRQFLYRLLHRHGLRGDGSES
jgi:DNA-binding NtrC family response regulator